jgi:uncharacterized protein (DUF2062 family)
MDQRRVIDLVAAVFAGFGGDGTDLWALAYCLVMMYWRWWVARQWKRRKKSRM